MMACDEAVMKQASAYLQTLQKVSQYQLGNQQLTLVADGGQQVLHYTWVP
jgi:heat shock protein HslJ